MTNTYHFRGKALSLVTITETPEAALLQNPKTGKYYIDYSGGTDCVEPCADEEEFKHLRQWWIQQSLETAAFVVRTTYPGADKASELYFSTDDEAQAFLDTCDNGEIEGVTIIGVDKLPSEGCTWNEIEYHGGLEVLG